MAKLPWDLEGILAVNYQINEQNTEFESRNIQLRGDLEFILLIYSSKKQKIKSVVYNFN